MQGLYFEQKNAVSARQPYKSPGRGLSGGCKGRIPSVPCGAVYKKERGCLWETAPRLIVLFLLAAAAAKDDKQCDDDKPNIFVIKKIT